MVTCCHGVDVRAVAACACAIAEHRRAESRGDGAEDTPRRR